MNVAQPPASTLVIPILYRDMLYYNTTSFPVPQPAEGGHPDFNRFSSGVDTGLVQSTLGTDSKPVWASNTGPGGQALTGAVDFCWWYHDTGCGDGGANPYAKLVYLDATNIPPRWPGVERRDQPADRYRLRGQVHDGSHRRPA
jgi:hypothetical protein